MVAVRKNDVAPMGLKIILVWNSTNMPRLTALGMAGGKDPAKGGLGWTNVANFVFRKMVSLTACVCVSEAF